MAIDGIQCIEVSRINSHALYMAYLSMAVRGLSFVVLTWTTVVLLGGFVSDLSKKDFWSLTVITLVQPAGIFDFLSKENANNVVTSLLFGSLVGLITQGRGIGVKERIGSFIPRKRFDPLWVFEVVNAISRYPLAGLYVLGMCISTAVSVWRLVQHDYGDDADRVENLKPGLKILYSLAVAQGVAFGYKFMLELGRTAVVERVAHFYLLDTKLVSDYLEKTLTGCMKDPSFAMGVWNLVTYAVELMESKLRNEHLSGVRILGTIMLQGNFRRSAHADLMKQLLTGWACFSHMVQRLVETFGPRSPYSTEIRVHAARIMANVAGRIHLEQFPSGMILDQYISFLLHPSTYEEYRWRAEGYEQDSNCLPEEYQQGWLLEGEELVDLYWRQKIQIQSLTFPQKKPESDKGLMVQGLRILQKLIMHEDNFRVIIKNTEGLLSKAMETLISDQLHRDHHDEWSSVAEELLELISRLLASLGEIGADMPRNILTNKEIVISTLKSVLGCPKCEVLLKRQAVEMLLDLSEDTSSVVVSGSDSRIFKWILLHIFLMEDKCFGKMCGPIHWAQKSSAIRKLAGERLQLLYLQTEGGTMSMVQQSGSGVIMGDLTRAIVDDVDTTYRLHAVQILEHLCILYTKDEELKEAILKVMPKVLKEILGRGSAPPGNDIEEGGLSPGHVQLNTCHEHQNGRKLREALVFLCGAVDRRWIYKDQVFTRQLNGMAAAISTSCHIMGTTFRQLVWRADYHLEEEKEKEKKMENEKDQRSAN